MSDVSSFTESEAVLKISCYFRRQISYYRKHEIIIIIKTKQVFVPIMSKFLSLLKKQQFWKYRAISEGNYLTTKTWLQKTEKRNFRRQISHYRKLEFIIIIKTKKAFVPFMSDVSCFTESSLVLKISCYFRRQISYYRQHELFIIIKTKKAFVTIMSKVSFFTESAAALKI